MLSNAWQRWSGVLIVKPDVQTERLSATVVGQTALSRMGMAALLMLLRALDPILAHHPAGAAPQHRDASQSREFSMKPHPGRPAMSSCRSRSSPGRPPSYAVCSAGSSDCASRGAGRRGPQSVPAAARSWSRQGGWSPPCARASRAAIQLEPRPLAAFAPRPIQPPLRPRRSSRWCAKSGRASAPRARVLLASGSCYPSSSHQPRAPASRRVCELWLNSPDYDINFSTSFKTPPFGSTGTCHLLTATIQVQSVLPRCA